MSETLDKLKALLGKTPSEAVIAEALGTVATDSERELRQQRVLALRLRRMTVTAIAAVVGCHQTTVSRDLAEMRETWRAKYGAAPTFDSAEALGESVEAYDEMESLAMLEFTRLSETTGKKNLSPMFAARQRMACLRTAAAMRQMKLSLLQDAGLMERQLGSMTVTGSIGNADVVRQRLVAAGVLQVDDAEAALVSAGEKTWATGEQVENEPASK